MKVCRGNPHTVGECAVATALIAEKVAFTVSLDAGVFARDLGMREREVAICATADCERNRVDRNNTTGPTRMEDESSSRFRRDIHWLIEEMSFYDSFPTRETPPGPF